jgi:stage III sporulation protein AG
MFRDKLKQLVKSNQKDEETEENNKSKIENLVFFAVLLIITIVIINLILKDNKQVTKQENNTSSKQLASNSTTTNANNIATDSLSEQLEDILSKIQGVGEVKVFVNYSESSEVVAMYNETTKTSNTEENDTSGGSRKIEETDSQKEIIYQEENGEKTPITQKIIQPKLEGAIITAKGASNAQTKANIIQAVEAATGLATHKIQVFEMN